MGERYPAGRRGDGGGVATALAAGGLDPGDEVHDEPSVTVVPQGEGEVVGDGPDRRVELLCDVDPLHATWSRFGPGREGADLHVHREHTDAFFVLEGELTLRLGPQGDAVARTTRRSSPRSRAAFPSGCSPRTSTSR